jgi:DNA modification methylase
VNVINQAQGEGWAFYNGDSAEVLPDMPSRSIDLSIFSPPFGSLYTYSATERDLGNCRNPEEFWSHFSFITPELCRVMKPGRNVCVHVAQIPTQKARDGVIGLSDFRGDTIRHFQSAGLTYHGEAVIWKNAQAQGIRTHSKGLLFKQMHKDSSWSRPALADYILVFRVPGAIDVPIVPDLTNDDWVEWASPIWQTTTTDQDKALAAGDEDIFDLAPGTPLLWYGIREGRTLNVEEARESDDGRHICPLQLDTIERCIRLWSNPGDTILSPFGGIASEGYQALKFGRRFVGVELKPTYWSAGVRNLQRAERESQTVDLVSLANDSPLPAEKALSLW